MLSHAAKFASLPLLIGLSTLCWAEPLDPSLSIPEHFDRLDTDGADLSAILKAEKPGNLAWGESYRLMAYVAMYEATGEPRYLDRVVARFGALLEIRDDRAGRKDEVRGRAMPAWGTGHYSKGKWYCWIVHAGMLTHPAASFVRLVQADPSLEARYGTHTAAFEAELRATITGFDEEWRDGPGPGEGYYHGRYLGKHLPLNQMNALGRTLVELAAATGDTVCEERAARLARFFKRRLARKPSGAYDWAYWPPLDPSGPSGGEDISHGAINADFAALCYEQGFVFAHADMKAFAATFTQSVTRGPDGFADTVAGTGDSGRYVGSIGRWLRLSPHDPAIWGLCHQHYFALDPPPSGPVAMLALANLARYDRRHRTGDVTAP